MEAEIRAYLESHLAKGDEIRRLVACTGPDGSHPNRGWVYDAELGFVHAPGIRSGIGVNGANISYDYEEDRARKLVNFADRTCRVHTYGDSFTHCDQVNDGETWQEYLAAHLQEPIRNYGVGAYSVYQAYRRMRKVRDTGERAEYIVLNIFDDDHYRNLVWRGLNVFAANQVRPWPGITFLPTRPYLRVDIRANTYVERDNLIATVDDLNKLRDLDFLYAEFGEDPITYLGLATETEGERSLTYLDKAAESFGLTVPADAAENIEAAVKAVFSEAALYSTRKVVELIERFCTDYGIELMFVLSYRQASIRSVLGGDERFDQGFVDWLKNRPHPVVDMCESFKTEYEHSTLDPDTFLKRYYIGHHAPLGNVFTAWAMVDEVVNCLDPKPLTYQLGVGN